MLEASIIVAPLTLVGGALGGKNEALWTTSCLLLAVHSEQVDDSTYAATVHLCLLANPIPACCWKDNSGRKLEELNH